MTFTATIAAVSPGSGTPTGTVDFFDGTPTIGTTPLDTETLKAGVATFSDSSLTVATHSITAVYSGDTTYAISTSNVVSQVVNQASTTTALTSDPNPSVSGQSVTFTATIAAVSPGSGTPTGTVNFLDDTTVIGTAEPLTAGVATFSTSTLTVATHSITAVYSGDPNFTTSPSSVLSQDVKQASTTTCAHLRPNPSVSGQSVTFTATDRRRLAGLGHADGYGELPRRHHGDRHRRTPHRGRSDLQHQHFDGRHALDHRSLLRRHELHYQYLECRPGCEAGEHDDRAHLRSQPQCLRSVGDVHGDDRRRLAGLGHADGYG